MAPTRSLQRAAGRPTRASKKVLLDRLPGTDARRDGSSLPAAQHALEQLDVLAEVPRAEEQVTYARLRRCADALRAVGSSKSSLTRPPNACRSRAPRESRCVR